MSPQLALNSGVPRRSKWSGFETAADDLPASSAPPPLTQTGSLPRYERFAARPLASFHGHKLSFKLSQAALEAGQAEIFAGERAGSVPSAGIILSAKLAGPPFFMLGKIAR